MKISIVEFVLMREVAKAKGINMLGSIFKTLFCVMIVIVLPSCNNTPIYNKKNHPNNDILAPIDGNMFADENAANHIQGVRDYIYSNATYYKLTESDLEKVKTEKPKISYNNNTLINSFTWNISNGLKISVKTSPPPLCNPLEMVVKNRQESN